MEFLEELLDRHEVADGDVEFSVEWIAKEYNKQDGMGRSLLLWHISQSSLDAQMKVSLDVLHRVYETFQNGESDGVQEHATIDPDNHIFVIDSFEMPLWNWSTERSTFER